MINRFTGQWRCLSNFYPVQIPYEGDMYPSVEHAYQAAKTLDNTQRWRIMQAVSPGSAKHLGRQVTLRPDWEDVKIAVMRELLEQKFAYPALRQRLLDTRSHELVEGNTWGDRFWGQDPVGTGENWLGRLLMEIRDV